MDTILVVEGVEVPVDRLALAGFSPYFAALFTGDFKEKDEPRIHLHDVPLEEFLDSLDILFGKPKKYTPGQMSTCRLASLLHLSDQLFLEPVRAFCQLELYFVPSGSEIIDRFKLAKAHSLSPAVLSRLFSVFYIDLKRVFEWDGPMEEKLALRDLASYDADGVLPSHCPPESAFDFCCEFDGEDGKEYVRVNKAVMCSLSPRFSKLIKENPDSEVLYMANMMAAAFKDCVNVVHGIPVDDYDIGQMCSSRFGHLCSVAFQLQLHPVFRFLSTEMHIVPEGIKVERYLQIYHYNIMKYLEIPPLTKEAHNMYSLKDEQKKLKIERLEEDFVFELDVRDLTELLKQAYSSSQTRPIEGTTLSINISTQYLKPQIDVSSSRADNKQYSSSTLSPEEVPGGYPDAFDEQPSTSDSPDEMKETVLISVRGNDILVEKMFSSYFEGFSVMINSQNSGRIVIDDVHPAVFKLCLSVLRGSIPQSFTKGSVPFSYLNDLYKLATKISLEPVKQFCREQIEAVDAGVMDKYLLEPDNEEFTNQLRCQSIKSFLEREMFADVVGWDRVDSKVTLTLKQLRMLLKKANAWVEKRVYTPRGAGLLVEPPVISRQFVDEPWRFGYLKMINDTEDDLLVTVSAHGTVLFDENNKSLLIGAKSTGRLSFKWGESSMVMFEIHRNGRRIDYFVQPLQ